MVKKPNPIMSLNELLRAYPYRGFKLAIVELFATLTELVSDESQSFVLVL